MLEAARAIAPLILVTLLFDVAGCALRHDEIAPEPINPASYAQADCRQLAQMQAKSVRSLILSEIVQDARYEDDRTRTFGVPTPMATIFEGRGEGHVARLKGDTLALAAQLEREGCLRDR